MYCYRTLSSECFTFTENKNLNDRTLALSHLSQGSSRVQSFSQSIQQRLFLLWQHGTRV
jgi:hypothetical protein